MASQQLACPDMEMKELDELLAELGRVMDRLSALPEDAFQERLQLLREQKRLRGRAASLREGASVDRESLEAELAGLVARWENLQQQRIDVVTQSAGGYGGDTVSAAQAMELNRQIDVSEGRDRIEERIAEIRRRLAKQD